MEVSRILFFLVPPQVLARFSEKYCQNLRRYQKNQSLEVKILPKPEEVPKKTQKNKVSEVLGLEVSRILVFLVPPQVLARFSGKILPKPEEVPKKPKSRDENLAKT